MMKPLNDNILVKRLEEESISRGGIIIPDTAKEKPSRAVIKAVGPGKRAKDGSHQKPEVNVGDVVLFGKYSGTEVKLDGENFIILRADDILAIIED